MNLDPTAARANEPGWTPEARKAAKAAEKEARRQAKAAKRAAYWSGVRRSIAAFFAAIWAGLAWAYVTFLSNIVLVAAVGACVGTGLWEWVNTWGGWRDMYPGAGAWTMIGAAGGVLLWFTAMRLAREEGRKPTRPDGPIPHEDRRKYRSPVELAGWIVCAIFAFAVCVVGVFMNQATNSTRAIAAAQQSKSTFRDMVIDRDALAEDLEIYNAEYWEATANQNRRALDSLVRIARGSFQMADLDPDKGCAGNLSFNQRRLCARANGGIDENSGETVIGLRAQIENDERALKKAKADELRLAELNREIKDFNVLSGDETAAAMGDIAGARNAAGAMALMYLLLSSAFLFASGWALDWAIEEIVRKLDAWRAKKGKATA